MGVFATHLSRHGAATIVDGALIVDLARIAMIWCVGSAMVNPIGEFPLNDDWSFARAVQSLIETGDYRPLGWAVMTLFSHVLWGALFCLPAGFSFTALRVAVLVAGLLGLFGTYVLARDLRQPRSVGLAITLMLAFYPPYFLLSHTFMTDIPFTAAAIWSVVFLARALRSDSAVELLIGTSFAVAAMLSRQVGLSITVAFAIALLLRRDATARRVALAIAPLVLCVVVLGAYNYWLAATDRMPVQYAQLTSAPLKHSTGLWQVLFTLSVFGFYSPLYVGLALLPMFALRGRQLLWSVDMQRLWKAHRTGATAFAALAVVLILGSAGLLAWLRYLTVLPMPDRGNMLGRQGMGPFTLRDSIILNLDDHLATVPAAFWVVLTALAVCGALLLIAKLSLHAAALLAGLLRDRRRIADEEGAGTFLVLCACICLLPFLSYGFYDRYLILSIPLLGTALFVLSPSQTLSCERVRVGSIFAGVLLAGWAAISIGGTHDYLMWNRVRWRALEHLTQDARVPAADIDGGFEFNGWHFYDPGYRSDPQKSGWWVQGDTYLVGFGVVPGYTVINEYSYWHWFPPHVQKIVVMRKSSENSDYGDSTR